MTDGETLSIVLFVLTAILIYVAIFLCNLFMDALDHLENNLFKIQKAIEELNRTIQKRN